MAADRNPSSDKLLMDLAHRLMLCADINSNDHCTDCPSYKWCVHWWDNNVCEPACHQKLTKEQYLQLLVELPHSRGVANAEDN